MRILIDILHPAHVHFFRNFRQVMQDSGHDVLVTARDKDLTLELLDAYAIPAEVISTQRRGRMGLARELATRVRRLTTIARRFRPDVLTGIMGPAIAPVGRLLRRPAVVFYDTENATATNRWVYPLAAAVCTPDCYAAPVRGNHITYPGYHELAYLHPARFTPDPAVLATAGLRSGEPFSLVRFVGWQASHDLRERGLGPAAKRDLVEELARRGRVFVSSEGPLPDGLPADPIPVPAAQIHHLIAAADIVVGESATMASEAAVLGVPAVLVADTGRGYTDDEERRYGLVRRVSPANAAGVAAAVNEFLSGDRTRFAVARRILLDDKIDVTAWMQAFFTERRWER